MGFQEFFQLIKQGDQVKPGIINAPLQTLDQNINYLWELLQAAETGSTIFARNVTVEAGALVGMPVYFNANTQQFERALAQLETDSPSGQLLAAASSFVWGIVHSKHNSTLADLLLFGYSTLDISNSLAAGDTVSAGRYYLDSTTPGRLTKQRPPVTVQVLESDGAGKVFVTRQLNDLATDHVHFKFDLVAAPAGDHTPPTVGERHVITAADSAQEGWLPADDAIFEGNAPDDAAFGYNISADPTLNNSWPPLPADNAYLEWDKGEDPAQLFHGVPTGPTGLVILDKNGIWWMSDCYGDVPWPTTLDTSASESASAGAGIECPRDTTMGLRLWFTKLSFLTESTVVTSLVTDDDRIEILCEADPTKVGRTGALLLRLNLSFQLSTQENEDGYLALKRYDPVTQTFFRGPVVEGIYAQSANLTIVSSESEVRTVDGSPETIHQGLLGLQVSDPTSVELFVQLVRLDGVTEEFYKDIMYIGLPEDEETQYRARIHVPDSLILTNPKLNLKLRLLARTNGTLPVLTVTYRRVPAAPTLTALPTADTAMTLAYTHTVTTDQYVDVATAKVTVAPGDDFLFFVKRELGDSFSGDVGVLRQAGILTAGA